MKLNNRSDFVARVVIHDTKGEPVTPSHPFTMTFGTDNNAITYVARSDDAQLVRLNDDGKSYTVVFDFNASRPYLQNGRMWVRCAYIDDNDIFPDGKMNITVPQRLPYEIWDGRSDTDTEISVLIASAYVNVSPTIPDGTITKPKLSPELQAAIDGLVRGAVFMGVAYPQDEVDTTGLTKSFWLAYVDGVYPSYGGMSVPSDSDIAVMAFIYDGLGNWSNVPVLAGQFVNGMHNIQPRTISGDALRYAAISSAEIKFDAINQYHIQPNAVTNEKIGSGAVTTEKIAADAVGGSQMSPYAVTSRELADGAVIGRKIPTRTITQGHIVAGNIGYGLLRLRVAFPRVSREMGITLPTGVYHAEVFDYNHEAFGSSDVGEIDVVVWLGDDDHRPQSDRDWLDASLNGKCTLGHMSAISNEELSSAGNPTRRLTYTSGNGMQVAYLLDTTTGRFEPTKSVMEIAEEKAPKFFTLKYPCTLDSPDIQAWKDALWAVRSNAIAGAAPVMIDLVKDYFMGHDGHWNGSGYAPLNPIIERATKVFYAQPANNVEGLSFTVEDGYRTTSYMFFMDSTGTYHAPTSSTSDSLPSGLVWESEVLPIIEEQLSYGIEFDTAISSSRCTRIGNPALHRSLPIHNMMRGCLLNDDGKVVEYLAPNDWTQNVRDGSRGQVMVELPAVYYRKFEVSGTKCRVRISESPLPGYHQVRLKYASAYEVALQRSTMTLASVVNNTADYRGGNNIADWDGTYRSLLGKPATGITRNKYREYARKRKTDSTEWNEYTYDVHKDLFWLFAIEYATLSVQEPFNAELTAEGYKQGGLGAGVTNLNGTKWGAYNNYNPFIPCGYTDSLGNGTGIVEYTMPDEYDPDATAPLVTYVPRYRGIENPFGHLFKWTDGLNVRISPNVEDDGDGLSKVFVCSDPAMFNDDGYDGYTYIGDETRENGYVKRIIFGEGGDIMPAEVGGGSSAYFCDYHYTSIPTAETLRGVLFGGHAANGATAGFVFAYSNHPPSYAATYIGSRLCFIPAV